MSVDSTQEFALVNGRYAAWNDLSAHANERAGKAWALRVTGTHPQYGVEGDWLPQRTIDNTIHFDVSELSPGDILKVSGASHKKTQHRYMVIEAVGDKLRAEVIMEAQAIEKVSKDEQTLRQEVIHLARQANEKKLKAARQALS